MRRLSDEKLSAIFERIPESQRPKKLYFDGDESLLDRPKIAIVGSRRASKYSKLQTELLAQKLAQSGFVVVSGGAEGIDSSAHIGSYPSTIAVMPCGLDILYPPSNKTLLQKLQKNSLLISEYEPAEGARNYTFVHRNRLVVSMSMAVVIAEADIGSGSMRSAEYAIKYDIPIYVLSHRIGESLGTQKLLREGRASAIFDLELFLNVVGANQKKIDTVSDEALVFAAKMPTLGEFLELFGDRVYELEFDGLIEIKNGVVKTKS